MQRSPLFSPPWSNFSPLAISRMRNFCDVPSPITQRTTRAGRWSDPHIPCSPTRSGYLPLHQEEGPGVAEIVARSEEKV